jgi:RHS repeat-associated protein
VQEKTSGPLASLVALAYDADFRLAKATVQGAAVTFGYDKDGLVTAAGSLTLERDASNGLVKQVGDGFAKAVYTYNGYGEVESITWSFGSTTLYSLTLERDNLGRVTRRLETVQGAVLDRTFEHDALAQLSKVKLGPAVVESYQYDGFGNPTSSLSPALGPLAVAGQFDSGFAMTQRGAWSFTYDANAALASRTMGPGTLTSYQHSVEGELRSVTLPDGTVVSYVYDAFGRPAVRKKDGTVTHKYAWYDQSTLAAVLNPDDSVKYLLVYGTGFTPVYMQAGTKRYYLAYDDLGSVRLVVDQAGLVVQRYDYDAWGNVTQVKDPAFDCPFGFAGGRTDPDTGLVRFRYRDYAPFMGRFTTRDPLGFVAGFNPYAYVGNAPESRVDPLGLTEQAEQAKKILQEKGLPGKLIPDNVTKFTYDEKTGDAKILLDKSFTVTIPPEKEGEDPINLKVSDKITCTVSQGKLSNIKGMSPGFGKKIHTIERVDDSTVKFTGSMAGFDKSADVKVDTLPSLPPKSDGK